MQGKSNRRMQLIAIASALLAMNAVIYLARDDKNSGLAGSLRAGVNECSVKILSPAPGAELGWKETVEGVAVVPKGGHLWVFHSGRNRNRWYPNGGLPRRIDAGRWFGPVQLGGELDIGAEFHIAAAVMDESTNNRLKRWFVEKKWRSAAFPNTVEECPVDIVSVIRKR